MAWVRALTISLAFAALAGCSSAPAPTQVPTSAPFEGATLRIVMPIDEGGSGAFSKPEDNEAALDPQRDSWPAPYDTWELMRCCLARNLLSTNGRAADQGGSRLHPDVAESLPEISPDGLTWTLKLKPGLHYAPPLDDVEVTAPDFIRSFHRLLQPGHDDVYFASLYSDIVGADEYRAGEASSIAGFESPDPHTLVIKLTSPAGDLAPRLALAPVVPIPANPANPAAPFGVADGHDDGYGQHFVSSGPYMIEGSEALDFARPPAEQQPVAGLVPGQRVALVPNPSWSASTDSLREARPARIEIVVTPTLEDAIAAINAREADLLLNSSVSIPEETIAAVNRDNSLGLLFVNGSGGTLGVTINTAVPPFDDVHVRRAVNYAIDREKAVDVLGDPYGFRTAHHLVPDAMEDNLLLDYRPYAPESGANGVDLAQAEMALSEYDTNGDGVCDADVCRAIPIAVHEDAYPMLDLVVENFGALGLEVDRANAVGVFDPIADPSIRAALIMIHGWARDYLSASNFFVGQFYGPVALGGEFGNGSLVGASPEQMTEWGYEGIEVPNVDSRVEACIPLTGAAQFECWANLDQHMMENVVPSIPLLHSVSTVLASSRVVSYSWDELATAPAYDRIELTPD